MTAVLEVAPVDPSAWARVRRLRLHALGDAPDAFWTTLAEEQALSPSDWRARLEDEGTVTFVATADGHDVGLVVGLAPPEDRPGEAHLVALWVAPEARGVGVGDALVTAVAEWARAAGHRRVTLEVGDGNAPAVALYARAGFVATGRTSALPPPREHITEHERVLHLDPRPDDHARPAGGEKLAMRDTAPAEGRGNAAGRARPSENLAVRTTSPREPARGRPPSARSRGG